MSQLRVQPAGPLRGQVRVPGDKSLSHRSLLLGAISEGTSRVNNFLQAADCLASLQVVRMLGVEVEEPEPTTLLVHGRGLHGLREPVGILDCVRSGTTMRLSAGLLAGQPFFSILSGEPQLLRRPMGRIAEPLRLMGATVLGRDGGNRPPLAVQGGHLHSLDYSLPVASAQVKSALLLAGLYASGPTTLHMPGPARDHTERMLLAMGGCLEPPAPPSRSPVPACARAAGPGVLHRTGPQRGESPNTSPPLGGTEGGPPASHTLRLEPVERLTAVDLAVPGDLSSAAFLIVAATLVPGSEITIRDVGINPTRTGLLDALWAMGADMTLDNEHLAGGEPVADLTICAAELRPIQVSGSLVVRAIDELPILAVAATQATGETLVRDAAELRVKETDRIATTVEELRHLGAKIEALPDGFVVRGPTQLQNPEPGEGHWAFVRSHGDHRLAMALAVAGLVARGGALVDDVDCIADSFPGFEVTLARLQGERR